MTDDAAGGALHCVQRTLQILERHPGVTAGFFNPAHPYTVQVLHPAGMEYLRELPSAKRAALPRALRKKGMAVLISRAAVPEAATWEKAGIVCLRCKQSEHEWVHGLRQALIEQTTTRTIVHGVLLDVNDLGVVLTGASGVGKSTLALELLARGHKLVADDAVEMRRPASGILIGQCPPLLRGYLEARGLGVLDIRALHSRHAMRKEMRLDLIIHLSSDSARKSRAKARLSGQRTTRRILGVTVPVLTLTASPPPLGHNLATLVETACLDQWLRLSGLAADKQFAQRLQRAIKQQS